MPYDAKQELEKVKKYYANDPLQKRFSLLASGETNSGKSYLFRTCRMPVHIDSFDPGGTKCLAAEPGWKEDDPLRITSLYHPEDNPVGQIIADTTWESEDPFQPKAYAEWKKVNEIRLKIGYFDQFGTYGLDSLTTLGQAIMNYEMGDKSGEVPRHRVDYNPQKVEIENRIRRLMNLHCDFILTAHLERLEKLKSIDKSTGIRYEEVQYRIMVTGKAVMTLPLLFDELYVLTGKGNNPRREMYTDHLGEYIARSRFKKGGADIKAVEPPDIKALLKKAGLQWEDKPRLG